MTTGPGYGFPKRCRILRRSDFRKVYDEGFRYTCRYFAAFCLRAGDPDGNPRIGFTVPRSMGKAVVRNTMKRRTREAVRLHLNELPQVWWIVFNPRKPALEGPFTEIEAEVSKLFLKCAQS